MEKETLFHEKEWPTKTQISCFEDDANLYVKETDYTKMLIVGIPKGTSSASLFVDLFLYSCGADFIQGLLNKSNSKKASQVL
jgi:hypothetical protein